MERFRVRNVKLTWEISHITGPSALVADLCALPIGFISLKLTLNKRSIWQHRPSIIPVAGEAEG